MLFFIGFVFIMFAVLLFMTETIGPAIVCLIIGLIFGAISESAKKRKRKKAEATRGAQGKSSGGIFGFLFRVIWGIVTLPFKLIVYSGRNMIISL